MDGQTMLFRRKLRPPLCALVAAACAVTAPGCASWQGPRIDPSGERILIWPGQAPPVVSPPPTASPFAVPAGPRAVPPPATPGPPAAALPVTPPPSVDAQFAFPATTIAQAGHPLVLTTIVTRRTD